MAPKKQRTIRDLVPIRNVLVSVSDKSGLAAFAAGLVADCPGVRLFSAGATSELLASMLAVSGGSADRVLVPLETYTGSPETRGHLVRILDRKIYLGLLAEEGDTAHAAELEREGAVAFDMVVGSFLPFAEAQERGADAEELRLLVDVGGPAMLSAAARNYLRVAALSSPDDYDEVLGELKENAGCLSLERRLELAAATFRRVAEHSEAVTDWMEGLDPGELATLYHSS